MLSSLQFFIKERKNKLVVHLYHSKDDISLEKQHQIYGAINELDSILKTICKYREKYMEGDRHKKEMFLFKPLKEKSMVKEFLDSFKEFF